jgi:hypothetical protein
MRLLETNSGVPERNTTSILRALSFIGLGAVLIGIGLVYQKQHAQRFVRYNEWTTARAIQWNRSGVRRKHWVEKRGVTTDRAVDVHTCGPSKF